MSDGFDLTDLGLGRAELVFAVEPVEDLQRYAGSDGPLGYDRRNLIILKGRHAGQGHLRCEIGPLEPHVLRCQLFLISDLLEQRAVLFG